MTKSRAHTELPGRLSGDLGELLKKHHILYSAGFTWSPKPSAQRSFRSEYYATSEEADNATAHALRSLGYQKPRWWEYWRWGETRPNERVMEKLRK